MNVAITGHRDLPEHFDRELLVRDLTALAERGFRNFYIGMALGFDTACYLALDRLRDTFPDIRRIACVPCPGQDRYFKMSEKVRYRAMLEASDETHVVGARYDSRAMMARNRFMVDRADAVYAFMERGRGGTANTVRYAHGKDKPVIFYGFSKREGRQS